MAGQDDGQGSDDDDDGREKRAAREGGIMKIITVSFESCIFLSLQCTLMFRFL